VWWELVENLPDLATLVEPLLIEVLSIVSRSPGDLQPVFQAMLENAVRICEAKFGLLFRFDGNAFHAAAGVGFWW